MSNMPNQVEILTTILQSKKVGEDQTTFWNKKEKRVSKLGLRIMKTLGPFDGEFYDGEGSNGYFDVWNKGWTDEEVRKWVNDFETLAKEFGIDHIEVYGHGFSGELSITIKIKE